MMIIMRYPEGHKQAVRERILSAAAVELRCHGLAGISIPALMKRVGLTHGTFYSHFTSREDLVAEAIRTAATASADGPLAGSLTLEQSLAHYLSPEHLAHPERGCVIAALGGEGARQSAPVRSAFAAAAHGLLSAIESKRHPVSPSSVPSDEALQLVSTMVGSVVLARLVDDPALAQRLLEVATHSAEPLPDGS